MTVYALWHGGANYYFPDLSCDLEVFASLRAAREAFTSRRRYGDRRQRFTYVTGEVSSTFCVGVDETASMQVFLYDPRGVHDPYPDRLIAFGPRGGVVVSRC